MVVDGSEASALEDNEVADDLVRVKIDKKRMRWRVFRRAAIPYKYFPPILCNTETLNSLEQELTQT